MVTIGLQCANMYVYAGRAVYELTRTCTIIPTVLPVHYRPFGERNPIAMFKTAF